MKCEYPVCERVDVGGVVADEDGGSVGEDLGEEFADVWGCVGVEGCGGFVEKDDVWVRGQCSGNVDSLSFAA